MFIAIGLITVIVSVVVGYIMSGGNMGILMQPFEFLIIFGAAFGAFIASGSKFSLGGR